MEEKVSDSWGSEEGSQYQPEAVPTLDPIQWTASEFVSHQKSGMWYVALGGMSAVVIIIVYAVTRNILSALVVAAACMALGVLGARKPQTKRYQIAASGILIEDKAYPFNMFKSFSVIDDGAISCIWLQPLKKLAPVVAMYYPPDQEERIIMMLENFLPEEERQHDFVDRLSRRIRF